MTSSTPWWRKMGAGRTIFLVALFVLGACWPLKNLITYPPMAMRDFGTFWVSGHALRSGIDPYDVHAFKTLGDHLLGKANYNFTYPPHTLFLFFPLSYLPPMSAFLIWNACSLGLFWWAAKSWMPTGMPAFVALLVPGTLINLNYGQTGILYSALFLLAFRPSGLAAAALTIKPQLGLLVAPALLFDRRALATAIIATAALIGSSALIFANWPEFTQHANDVMGKNLTSFSQTLWMLKGTTPGIGYGLWGWGVFAIGATHILSKNYNVFTAATAAFLVSPYGLHYDMGALCLGFAIILYSQWERMPVLDKLAACLAFLSPVIVVFATTWVIPPILLWALLVQSKWSDGIRIRIRPREPVTRMLSVEPTLVAAT